jgi:hypothetical protein
MNRKAIVIMAALLLGLAACALGADEGDKGGAVGEGVEAAGGGYTWRREGGIAGFCDVVELSADGSAVVSSCASDPPRAVDEVTLSEAQQSLVTDWVAQFAPFQHEQSDAATADAMTIAIDFTGQGEDEPAENDLAAMSALAQEVLIQTTE